MQFLAAGGAQLGVGLSTSFQRESGTAFGVIEISGVSHRSCLLAPLRQLLRHPFGFFQPTTLTSSVDLKSQLAASDIPKCLRLFTFGLRPSPSSVGRRVS